MLSFNKFLMFPWKTVFHDIKFLNSSLIKSLQTFDIIKGKEIHKGGNSIKQ